MKKLSTRTLVLLALLIALQIILARMLGFYLTESMRVSFEYFIIILAGVCFGPLCGAIVGGLGDFLGATLFGLGFFPPLIVGPICAGLCAGLLAKYVFRGRLDKWWKLMVVTVVSETLFNLLWGTYALTLLYGSPFPQYLALRAPLKLCIIALDAQLVWITSRALRPVLQGRRNESR